MDFAADDRGDQHADTDLVDGDGATDHDAGIGLADGAAVERSDTDGRAGDLDLFGCDAADGATVYGKGRHWGVNRGEFAVIFAGGFERHWGHRRSRGVKAQF